ncbi:MAG: hypothetical protein AB7N80_04020 [Bdellovibrionales bacterium]
MKNKNKNKSQANKRHMGRSPQPVSRHPYKVRRQDVLEEPDQKFPPVAGQGGLPANPQKGRAY